MEVVDVEGLLLGGEAEGIRFSVGQANGFCSIYLANDLRSAEKSDCPKSVNCAGYNFKSVFDMIRCAINEFMDKLIAPLIGTGDDVDWH